MLEPRVSALDDDLDDLGESSDEEEEPVIDRHTSHRRARTPSPSRQVNRCRKQCLFSNKFKAFLRHKHEAKYRICAMVFANLLVRSTRLRGSSVL